MPVPVCTMHNHTKIQIFAEKTSKNLWKFYTKFGLESADRHSMLDLDSKPAGFS